MTLILIIAAGILLAMILLPLLGPIAMIAVCIAVIALLGCSIIFSIGVGMAAVDAAKEAAAKAKKTKKETLRHLAAGSFFLVPAFSQLPHQKRT